MERSAPTDKQRMIEILERQPDDTSYDELLRELAFERMIERGISDAETGRTISHEEMGRKVADWDK